MSFLCFQLCFFDKIHYLLRLYLNLMMDNLRSKLGLDFEQKAMLILKSVSVSGVPLGF